jgi:hypothetical protein
MCHTREGHKQERLFCLRSLKGKHDYNRNRISLSARKINFSGLSFAGRKLKFAPNKKRWRCILWFFRRRRFFSKFLISAEAIAGEIPTIAGDLDILTSLGGCKVALDKTNNQEDGEVN